MYNSTIINATNVYGKIYCKDKMKITSNVTSYYSVCSLLLLPTASISPESISTDYPMRNQTISLIDSELEKIVEILNNGSITNNFIVINRNSRKNAIAK